MEIKIKAPIGEVKSRIQEIDLTNIGIRLSGIASIGEYTYVGFEPLIVEGKESIIQDAIEDAKGKEGIPSSPPENNCRISNSYIDPDGNLIVVSDE